MVSLSQPQVTAKAAFQTTDKDKTTLGAGLQVPYSHVISLHNEYADPLYLSDELFLFCRLWHIVHLLVQLSEGCFSITLSLRWPDGACSHGGRMEGSCFHTHGLIFIHIFGTRTKCQVILAGLNRILFYWSHKKTAAQTNWILAHYTKFLCQCSLKIILLS